MGGVDWNCTWRYEGGGGGVQYNQEYGPAIKTGGNLKEKSREKKIYDVGAHK